MIVPCSALRSGAEFEITFRTESIASDVGTNGVCEKELATRESRHDIVEMLEFDFIGDVIEWISDSHSKQRREKFSQKTSQKALTMERWLASRANHG